MKRTVLVLGTVAVFAATFSPVGAAPFDPLVRIGKIQGPCQVMTPDAAQYAPVESGKAYPFDSQFTTPAEGSLTLLFSQNNVALVGGNARFKVSQSPTDKAVRVIFLEEGRIDLTLEEGFEEQNGLQVVAQCCTVVCLKGGKSFVEARTEKDLHAQVAGCGEGEIKVSGPQFDIPVLKKDQWVSVACASDRRYVRVKDVKGEYEVSILGSDGQPKTVSLEPNGMIKIMQKASDVPGTVSVAILVVAPDNTPLESITYSTAGELPPAAPPEKPAPEKPGAPSEEWEPLWSTTTTSSTTTTTQPSIPPTPPTPTPVGRR
mgnify:CR=1 FL=1